MHLLRHSTGSHLPFIRVVGLHISLLLSSINDIPTSSANLKKEEYGQQKACEIETKQPGYNDNIVPLIVYTLQMQLGQRNT